MDKDKLLSLAERCEAAPGPDRELDRCLFAVKRDVEREDVTGPIGFSPTASLDAAMSLVPGGWGVCVEQERPTRDCEASVSPPDCEPWGPNAISTIGKTLALALCAAALRSHAQKEEG